MSQWGKFDRIQLVPAGSANANSTVVFTVTGSATVGPFAGNVRAGDALTIDNVDYRVAVVNSANTLTLDVPFTAANTTTANLAVQQSPKDLLTYGWGTAETATGNTATKRNVFGVDSLEASLANNRVNGVNTPGWVSYHTYTTSQGAVRRKAEPLVAMSKNFNRDSAGNLSTDANDDGIIFDA